MRVIRITTRIADGTQAIICRGDFWSGEFCNRIRVVMMAIPLEIVIVISEALVLQHGRLALK